MFNTIMLFSGKMWPLYIYIYTLFNHQGEMPGGNHELVATRITHPTKNSSRFSKQHVMRMLEKRSCELSTKPCLFSSTTLFNRNVRIPIHQTIQWDETSTLCVWVTAPTRCVRHDRWDVSFFHLPRYCWCEDPAPFLQGLGRSIIQAT